MQEEGGGLRTFCLPDQARRISVFDARVETIAYHDEQRILEVALKRGQVWQFFQVPREIFDALQDSTISSFLKFMAHKYPYAPVKTGMRPVIVPESEKCNCGSTMSQKHRTESDFDKYVRVLWSCQSCNATEWKQYGEGLGRERRSRWH
jgi:hypothetical protein